MTDSTTSECTGGSGSSIFFFRRTPLHLKDRRRCIVFPTLDAPCRIAMAHLGKTIGRVPWVFLLLPVFLTAGLGWPFFDGIMQFQKEALQRAGNIELFTPYPSRSMKDRKLMSNLFADGGYFAERSIISPNLLILMISAKDGGSVLRPEIADVYTRLRQRMESEVVIHPPPTHSPVNYNDLCHFDFYDSHCQQDPFISVWQASAQHFYASPSLNYPVTNFTVPTETSVVFRSAYIGPVFGDTTVDDNGRLIYARYVRMIFNLPAGGEHGVKLDVLRSYGKAWAQYAHRLHEPLLDIAYWSAYQYTKDMNLISQRTMQLLPVLGGLLLLFSLSSSCMADSVLSKPWLALSGILSAVSGIVCGYGILFLLGMKLIEIAMIVPFLVLSIGVDDMFVMLNVWRKSERHLSVPDRLSQTFRESAVSISITTLTDAGVFAVGAWSSFPAVRIFCTFSCVCMVMVFLFQITFFGACMALTGYREADRRHCLTFRIVPDSERYECCCNLCRANGAEEQARRWKPFPVLFFRDVYSTIITDFRVQIAVFFSYMLYFCVAIFCLLVQLQQGLKVSNLVPYDSDTAKYLRIYESEFWKYSTSAEVVIAEALDYSDPQVQTNLIDVAYSLEATPFTRNADFWLTEFLRLYPEAKQKRGNQFYSMMLDDFFRTRYYYKYAGDIELMETSVGTFYVNASRFLLPLVNAGQANRTRAMNMLHGIIDHASAVTGYKMYIFDVSFPLAEQYQAIIPGLTTNILVAAFSMLLITILFIPNLRCCITVSLAVLSVNLGVVAFLAAWQVNIDIISTITILLAIGFSVDFCSHITYHFYHVDTIEPSLLTTQLRLQNTLETVGWPIIQSFLSTLIGVVIVIGVKSYISDTFVKTVFLVMILGVYHALLILPILLYWIDTSCGIVTCQVYVQTSKTPTQIMSPHPMSYAPSVPPGLYRDRHVVHSSDAFASDTTPQITVHPTSKDTEPHSPKFRPISDDDALVYSSKTNNSGGMLSASSIQISPQQTLGPMHNDSTTLPEINHRPNADESTQVRVSSQWLGAWLHGSMSMTEQNAATSTCAYCPTKTQHTDTVVVCSCDQHPHDKEHQHS